MGSFLCRPTDWPDVGSPSAERGVAVVKVTACGGQVSSAGPPKGLAAAPSRERWRPMRLTYSTEKQPVLLQGSHRGHLIDERPLLSRPNLHSGSSLSLSLSFCLSSRRRRAHVDRYRFTVSLLCFSCCCCFFFPSPIGSEFSSEETNLCAGVFLPSDAFLIGRPRETEGACPGRRRTRSVRPSINRWNSTTKRKRFGKKKKRKGRPTSFFFLAAGRAVSRFR